MIAGVVRDPGDRRRDARNPTGSRWTSSRRPSTTSWRRRSCVTPDAALLDAVAASARRLLPRCRARAIIAASLARRGALDPGARPGRGLRDRQPHRARAPRARGRRSRRAAAADPPRRRDLPRPPRVRGARRLLRRARTTCCRPAAPRAFRRRSASTISRSARACSSISRGAARTLGPGRRHARATAKGLTAHAQSAPTDARLTRLTQSTMTHDRRGRRSPRRRRRSRVARRSARRPRAARVRRREGRGLIKLDAMENPVRPAGATCARSSRRRVADVADQPLSRRRRRRGEGGAARARSALPDGVGADARQRLRRAAPDAHGRGGATPGAVDARARSVVRHVPDERAARAACASSACRCAPTSRSTSTRCSRRSQRERPALVCLAYPNNPTGNLFAAARRRAHRRAPRRAWSSSTRPTTRSPTRTFLPRVLEFPNLVVVRTVSKIGMAGLRLGYAVGHPAWIAEFDKVRPPYNVNALTQAAAPVLLAERDAARRAGGGDPRRARAARRGAGRAARRHRVSDAGQLRPGARARRAALVRRAARRGHPGEESARRASAARATACASPSARRPRTTRCSPRCTLRMNAPAECPTPAHRAKSSATPTETQIASRSNLDGTRPRRRSRPACRSSTTCSTRSRATACSTSTVDARRATCTSTRHHTVEDIGITLGQAVRAGARRQDGHRAATATPTCRSTRRCRAS